MCKGGGTLKLPAVSTSTVLPKPDDASVPAVEASDLSKRFGSRWALSDCTLTIPPGRVTGLVGHNGAGKTTLLHLAVGLLRPTSGTITVFGQRPGARSSQLARVGFVAQERPMYAGLSVADHLRLGAHLNPGWDAKLATRRVERLELDPGQPTRTLSGGQRAQLALTLAISKRPQLLILDEPVASLDPLARRDFLQDLAETVAEHQLSVVLSSHLVADLARVCDYLIVLGTGRIRVAGDMSELLETHYTLTRSRRQGHAAVPSGLSIVHAWRVRNATKVLVRADEPVGPTGWRVSRPTLDDLVVSYMSPAPSESRRHDIGLEEMQ
jgi:ABC-2 type transport system ATP-binding protein